MQPKASSKTLILLRIGEIFLKGGNRSRFLKAFTKEARRLLADVEGAVIRPRYLRFEVEAPTDKVDACIARLKRLFGLQSMSPAVSTTTDLDALRAAALALAKRRPAGTTFKVETNRRDKSYPLISPQVSRQVGGYVDDHTDLVVDVRNPDLLIQIEITEDEAYVFGDVTMGPGGLPIGTGGRVGLLLSGGIDSPVAGWSAMRRGLDLIAVYFHSFPYTGDKTKEKVLTLARELARWHGKFPVWVVHFTEVQKQLRAAGRADLAVLIVSPHDDAHRGHPHSACRRRRAGHRRKSRSGCIADARQSRRHRRRVSAARSPSASLLRQDRDHHQGQRDWHF